MTKEEFELQFVELFEQVVAYAAGIPTNVVKLQAPHAACAGAPGSDTTADEERSR